MAEILEEWKNSAVITICKTGDKQVVENYGGISLHNARYKLYSKILIKIESPSRNFPFGKPEWSPKRQIFH